MVHERLSKYNTQFYQNMNQKPEQVETQSCWTKEIKYKI